MKFNNIIIFLLSLTLLLFSSCGSDYNFNDEFDLEELPGYVAFDAPGNTVTPEIVVVTESDGTATLNIECPTGTLSDITVTYEVSGTAIEGVDYTIDGASGSTGTIVLPVEAGNFQDRHNVDLVVNILEDGVFDETKELIITLISASNADGNIPVGRGGTEYLKVSGVIINNVDCGSTDFSGAYDYVTSDYFCENADLMGSGMLTQVSPGVFTFDDWAFGTYQECYGNPAASWGTLALEDCSNTISVTGVDGYGDAWTMTVIDVAGPVLTIRFENPFPEFGTVVLTRTDGTDWPALTN